MAEIVWQIIVFLAPRPGPTGPWPRKKNWAILFCPNECKCFFGTIGCIATELLDHLFSTEWQSDRMTESQTFLLHIRVGEICLCSFLINSPTRFACRGTIRDQYLIWGNSYFPRPPKCCLKEKAQVIKIKLDWFQDCCKNWPLTWVFVLWL